MPPSSANDRNEPLPQGGELRHLDYIDAVRGFAFLAVLAAHSAFNISPFPGSYILEGGVYGVQLFFLASAITLCYSMDARNKVDRYPLLSFFLRRFFRIAPMFWLAIIFYSVFPNVMPRFWLGEGAPHGTSPVYFFLTATFAHGWHPYTFNSIVPGGWSIAVEMNFYLLFPLLYRMLARSIRLAAAAVVLGVFYLRLLLLFTSFPLFGFEQNVWSFFARYWLPAQIPVFLLGFFAYHLTRDPLVRTRLHSWLVATTVFIAALLFTISALRGASLVGVPQMMTICFGLTGIFVSLSAGSLRLITNRVIRKIGELSYSCYLVHFAGLGLTLRLLGIHPASPTEPWNAGSRLSGALHYFAMFVISLGFTVVFASITRELIEKPGIALGKKLIQRLNTSDAVAISAARQVLPS